MTFSTRQISTLSILILALACLTTTQAEAADAPRPNILFILVDDLGYGDLSSYGATDIASPNIDKLVEQGINLTQFYANCPVCSPTRAAFLSGMFPDRAGVPGVIRTHDTNSWGKLRTDIKLLPETLKTADYTTACIGKWHLGLEAPNTPTLRGFDYFWGFLGDMMDDYWHHRRHGNNYMKDGTRTIDPEGHATDLFTEKACEWLKSYKGQQPFFLYMAYNAPHSPVHPPKDWLERYVAAHPDVPMKRAKFAAFVEHTDDAIGKVVAALKETPAAENTLIVFSSDNGGANYHGASNGKLKGQKQDMDEGGIRVPTCVVWPGHIEPGTTSDRVAMTMDFYPTLCKLAGAEIPNNLDAIDISPLLLGEEMPPEDRYLFWVRLEGGGRYQGTPYHAVRHGDWKLTQNDAKTAFGLYNIAEDPYETKNRIVEDATPETKEIAARLLAALDKHLKECESIPWK